MKKTKTAAMLPIKLSLNDDFTVRYGFRAKASLPLN